MLSLIIPLVLVNILLNQLNMVKILLFTVQRNGFGGHGATIGGYILTENALELARWLESRDDILWVLYPGLDESYPHHENAKKYMRNGFGCIWLLVLKMMLMLELHSLMLYKLQLASHLAYVRDAITLVMHRHINN
ncbi:unnamed protein product [Rhizophagus irregularis]|nr:unnamed protein product [Rhizophagus irregularis]